MVKDSPNNVITPNTTPIFLSHSSKGVYSDYTFSFAVNTDIDESNIIWIKFPSVYDPFVTDYKETG